MLPHPTASCFLEFTNLSRRDRACEASPACLLVRIDQPHRRAADLLKEGAAGKVPLISLPSHELLPRLFQKEMIRRNIVWRTAMETSSQDSVPIYVRNGLGAGLAVQTPDLQHDSGLRVLPLSGFPSLPIGVFWRGKLGEIRRYSSTNWRSGQSRFLAGPKAVGFDVWGARDQSIDSRRLSVSRAPAMSSNAYRWRQASLASCREKMRSCTAK